MDTQALEDAASELEGVASDIAPLMWCEADREELIYDDRPEIRVQCGFKIHGARWFRIGGWRLLARFRGDDTPNGLDGIEAPDGRRFGFNASLVVWWYLQGFAHHLPWTEAATMVRSR